MIDIKVIRESPKLVKKAARDKGMAVDIDRVLELDESRRRIEQEFDTFRHDQKAIGELMASLTRPPALVRAAEKIAAQQQLFKASIEVSIEPIYRFVKQVQETLAPLRKQNEALSRAYEQLKPELPNVSKTIPASMETVKQHIKALEANREKVTRELSELMLLVPQIPHPDAPIGPDESGNVEVRKVGEPRRKTDFGFEFKDHVDLGAALKLFDLERGVKLAGSRNYVLTGAGAMLHEAVLRLAWDLMMERGFTPLTVPVLVTENLMVGAGFFPVHRDEAYLAERDEKCLVGTAEVPVTGLHGDEILSVDELPKTYVARSTCFRREAGAAGKDTRGLYRIHFFDKLEQVVVCRADAGESANWHATILQNSEDLLQALELPYRVVEVCTGDMGQGKVRMYDIETWMPSRDAYSETHSASSFHDFQARRLKLRYKDEDGKTRFCHTLNNTVVASPRILIPLLEANQNEDSSITIPEALRKYMRGMERIGPA